MMQFTNTFTVDSPADETFDTLLDVQRVAPCLPGVTLTGQDGNSYQGALKLKLGPMVAHYEGAAEVSDVDRVARTAILVAKGSEVAGGGGAEAQVRIAVAAIEGASEVTIDTDVNIRGRAAQFGRGVISDVAQRMTNQFAANLQSLMGQEVGTSRAAPGTVSASSEARSGAVADEPLDLLGMGLEPLLRSGAPYLVAFVVGVLIGRIMRSRDRSRYGYRWEAPAGWVQLPPSRDCG